MLLHNKKIYKLLLFLNKDAIERKQKGRRNKNETKKIFANNNTYTNN